MDLLPACPHLRFSHLWTLAHTQGGCVVLQAGRLVGHCVRAPQGRDVWTALGSQAVVRTPLPQPCRVPWGLPPSPRASLPRPGLKSCQPLQQ